MSFETEVTINLPFSDIWMWGRRDEPNIDVCHVSHVSRVRQRHVTWRATCRSRFARLPDNRGCLCREGVQLCTVACFLVVLVVAPPGELGQLGGRGAPLGDGRPVPSPRLGPFKLTRTDLGCQLLEQAPRQ